MVMTSFSGRIQMISQAEANRLIGMEKKLKIESGIILPPPGKIINIEATSLDDREEFIFSVQRGRIRLEKYSQQERYAEVVPLVRLCVDYKPHTNPPGFFPFDPGFAQYAEKDMGSTHLHLYLEEINDKFAIPVPNLEFHSLSNISITTLDFLKYCHVINAGSVQSGLI
jgi:hypothetical protein